MTASGYLFGICQHFIIQKRKERTKKKSWKKPKEKTEAVIQRRTDNTKTKCKKKPKG
jgi:hypothetical protein